MKLNSDSRPLWRQKTFWVGLATIVSAAASLYPPIAPAAKLATVIFGVVGGWCVADRVSRNK